jgi:hypothetical protein
MTECGYALLTGCDSALCKYTPAVWQDAPYAREKFIPEKQDLIREHFRCPNVAEDGSWQFLVACKQEVTRRRNSIALSARPLIISEGRENAF